MEIIDGEHPVPESKNFFSQIASIAGYIDVAKKTEGAQKADYVALKRLNADTDALTVQEIAALTRVLEYADVAYERFNFRTWRRWAFIAHGIALTSHSELGREPQEERGRLGRQLFEAGVSEARLRRLLNARGPAFFQTLSHVLRMMQNKGIDANWVELAVLVLREGTDDRRGKEREETARVRIVSDFLRAKPAPEKNA